MRIFILVLLLSLSSFAGVEKWSSSLPEDSIFKASPEMKKTVNFWVKIYSYYSTTQGVFHLVNNPAITLGEIDLTDIFKNKELSAFEKKKMIEAKVKSEKKRILNKYGIKNPREVRLQMGLRDRMKKAMYLSGRYLERMERIFEKENLPIELTRLVYVESSFNVYAQSKVGASGLWQIMPNVARAEGYIGKNYDKRNHPIEATKLAAKILKQNYRSLESWPLAVTAYNHGLTGVRRMLTRNKATRLEELIASKNVTRTWGFASKNFYACLLAVLKVERNAHKLFGEDLIQAQTLAYKEFKLKSSRKKSEVIKWYDGSVTRLKLMNPHLNWSVINRKKRIPAGVSLMVPKKNIDLVRN